MVNDLKNWLSARIKRNTDKASKIDSEHKGNEANLTYHGGFTLGFYRGRLSSFEDVLDHISELEGEHPIMESDIPFGIKPINNTEALFHLVWQLRVLVRYNSNLPQETGVLKGFYEEICESLDKYIEESRKEILLNRNNKAIVDNK